MEQIFQLRMQEQELTMRQMVEEIHRGKFNIRQAAIKFEVNYKTVKHWLEKVEQEAALVKKEPSPLPTPKPTRKKKPAYSSPEQATAQILELQTKINALERKLKASDFKALYYSTLIKLAEQELGIDIEKKFVTRQSDSCK